MSEQDRSEARLEQKFDQRFDEVLEHVTQSRMLIEVMVTQNRATSEATELYRQDLSARIDELDARLTGRLDTLTLAVRHNSADIQKNSADIQKNSADIQKNSADIQKNSADIQGLSIRMKEMSAQIQSIQLDSASMRERLGGLVARGELGELDRRVTALEARADEV